MFNMNSTVTQLISAGLSLIFVLEEYSSHQYAASSEGFSEPELLKMERLIESR